MLQKARRILFIFLILLVLSACPDKEQEAQDSKTNNSPEPYQNETLTLSGTPMPSVRQKDPNELVSFSTEILNKDEDRVHNIKIAAEEINHLVLEPDEVFSFNEILGRRSDSKGYEKAPILLGNGKKGEGTGGGVCQVSTTLYNAALKADLKILERHRHSEPVPYVEEGKDATVVYNTKDLRFRNTLEHPVEIVVWVDSNRVTVKLLKKSDSQD